MIIEKIIEGSILLLLAVLLRILMLMSGRLQSDSGCEALDGIVTESDITRKEILVKYTLGGVSYTAPYRCEAYAMVNEMPPVNLKVRVMVSPDAPDQIVSVQFMREMGRGLSGKHAYIDYRGKRNTFTLMLLFVILFGAGLYMLLQGIGLL